MKQVKNLFGRKRVHVDIYMGKIRERELRPHGSLNQFYEAFLTVLIGNFHFLSPPYSPSKIRSVTFTSITKSNKISSDFRDQGVNSGF